MANSSITGVSIYSNDSTQTSVSVTIGEDTFTYSGTYAGDTYAGPQSGAFALDGMDVTVTAASETAVDLCIKDTYIHDSETSDSNKKWNGIVMTTGTSVISGSTFTRNNQNNPDGYGRGVVLASGGSLWIDNTVFDSNYCKSQGIVYKRTSGTVNISGSTFINNSGGACVITFTTGWLNISGTSAAPTLFIDNQTLAVNNTNAYGWTRISGATFSGNPGAVNNEMKMIIESGSDGTRALFSQNSRSGNGGAVLHDNKYRTEAGGPSWISISDAVFDRNIGGNGGGLFAGSSFSLIGTTFSGNTATGGGGLYINGGTGYEPVISGNTFANNVANNGGAVYVTGTNANVFSNSVFSANTGSSIIVGLFRNLLILNLVISSTNTAKTSKNIMTSAMLLH